MRTIDARRIDWYRTHLWENKSVYVSLTSLFITIQRMNREYIDRLRKWFWLEKLSLPFGASRHVGYLNLTFCETTWDLHYSLRNCVALKLFLRRSEERPTNQSSYSTNRERNSHSLRDFGYVYFEIHHYLPLLSPFLLCSVVCIKCVENVCICKTLFQMQ